MTALDEIDFDDEDGSIDDFKETDFFHDDLNTDDSGCELEDIEEPDPWGEELKENEDFAQDDNLHNREEMFDAWDE